MTLADTSVWIDHFRSGNAKLRDLLMQGQVAIHPMVIGELACGNLARRTHTLALLERLPRVRQVRDSIVHSAFESLHLHGQGIGWIDAHLLVACRASVQLDGGLWTLDQRLAKLYQQLEDRNIG